MNGNYRPEVNLPVYPESLVYSTSTDIRQYKKTVNKTTINWQLKRGRENNSFLCSSRPSINPNLPYALHFTLYGKIKQYKATFFIVIALVYSQCESRTTSLHLSVLVHHLHWYAYVFTPCPQRYPTCRLQVSRLSLFQAQNPAWPPMVHCLYYKVREDETGKFWLKSLFRHRSWL